ncbi:hypothetical protein V7J57_27465, partial [Escherichia coli]|uniref:hypothetical protein n=1 Tax=Escherichia coli TaxID=562 RepID=UPI003218B06F
VDGSRAWRSFEDYLLPHHVFGQMRAESRLGLAIPGNDSNLLIVFYVQIMPDDFVMQLHRF